MRAIVTGLNGTVAPAVADALQRNGHTVIGWNRAAVPIDDAEKINAFFHESAPDAFFHIATGPPQWAELVARLCFERDIKFLFTSSVSVFSENGSGPYSTHDAPTATDEYGRYKIECERLVQHANPSAFIARLGWQIGHAPGSNNMIDYLERTMRNDGKISASTRWISCCSFLEDTATALLELIGHHSPALYHLNGNPGWNFYDIVCALNALHGNRWLVEQGMIPNRNDTLLEDRIKVRPIDARLKRSEN